MKLTITPIHLKESKRAKDIRSSYSFSPPDNSAWNSSPSSPLHLPDLLEWGAKKKGQCKFQSHEGMKGNSPHRRNPGSGPPQSDSLLFTQRLEPIKSLDLRIQTRRDIHL